MSRAASLRSIRGAATTMLALHGWARDARRLLGAGWELPSEAAVERDAAPTPHAIGHIRIDVRI
jgi:hypothetical protein